MGNNGPAVTAIEGVCEALFEVYGEDIAPLCVRRFDDPSVLG